MEQFKKGDVVQLKSGGPKMTVDEIETTQSGVEVICVWYNDKSNSFERKGFSVEALTIYTPPSQPKVIRG